MRQSPGSERPSQDERVTLTTRLGQGFIVSAAGKVFARRGFDATRVEDILQAAPVARRTFYKYFSSKEDVLAAIYELATGELLKTIRAVSSDDPLQAMRRGLDAYLDYHMKNAS